MPGRCKNIRHSAMLRCVLIICFAIFSIQRIVAEEMEADVVYPVTGVYNFEIGERRAVAEYLSPMTYKGTDYAVSGYWDKVMPFDPQRWLMSFDARVSYTKMLNPAWSASSLGLDAKFGWQMRRYFRLPYNITFSVGGGASLTGGVIALLRNSNNPVDVTIRASLDLGASLSWRTRLGRIPVVASERMTMPVLGAFFMPQYGETFYEIYLGNHSGLAHFGWWGNMPCLDNLVSVSLDLGNTALQLGYRLTIGCAYANNLSTRQITNGFVIGVIPSGMGLKRKKCREELRPM